MIVIELKILLVEALSRCGVSDDGVVKVTVDGVVNGPLCFTKQNTNRHATSPVTGTSLTDQLGVIDLLHTEEKRIEEGRRREDQRRQEKRGEDKREEKRGEEKTRRED